MGYHHLDLGDIPPDDDRSATRRSIADHLGFTNLGLNHYEIAPGEQAPLRYHYHTEQEEVFYVLEGDLHVETKEDEVVVSAGELFAVEPGFPQRAYNPPDATDVVRTLVVGAPAVDDFEFPEE